MVFDFKDFRFGELTTKILNTTTTPGDNADVTIPSSINIFEIFSVYQRKIKISKKLWNLEYVFTY